MKIRHLNRAIRLCGFVCLFFGLIAGFLPSEARENQAWESVRIPLSVVQSGQEFRSYLAQSAEAELQTEQPEQPAVLQGGVKKTVYDRGVQPVSFIGAESSGWVEALDTRQPLDGVTVSIPELGYRTTSGQDGRFTLPSLSRKPVIVSFRKAGYVPATVTLDRNSALRQPLKVFLSELRNTLVLDDRLHHLGDGSFSPASAGAGQFRQRSEGPVLRLPFTIERPAQETMMLEIGSIIGLDTEAAHVLGQSRFHRMSSPMRVVLNGQPIGEIAANGDRRRILIPVTLLRESQPNLLEIYTGFRQTATGSDYDDMELMLVTITLHRV